MELATAAAAVVAQAVERNESRDRSQERRTTTRTRTAEGGGDVGDKKERQHKKMSLVQKQLLHERKTQQGEADAHLKKQEAMRVLLHNIKTQQVQERGRQASRAASLAFTRAVASHSKMAWQNDESENEGQFVNHSAVPGQMRSSSLSASSLPRTRTRSGMHTSYTHM